MLRFFRVKKDVKGVNPLNDAKNTYYEEVSAGGLQPNERALKVCYQNGDVWEARNLTTKSDQTAITKIFNSTLYEFNGFFIIKNKNDTASKEYYCFITVDKTNEIKEDKHWLIWLTVYYDLDGSTGFKILLRWDLEQFIFTIVKNPIKINLLEDDNFNKEENHYSLPTVAVIRKWYYHKEWLEINTPINNSQSMIYSIPVKCPMEDIELEMPKEDVIRQLIRARTNKTDKEYDLLSMDFGRQAGYNGYNSMIISMNQINNYDNMKAGNGRAWLSFLGNVSGNITNGMYALFCKISDVNGNAINHPLFMDILSIYAYKKTVYENSTWIYGYQSNPTKPEPQDKNYFNVWDGYLYKDGISNVATGYPNQVYYYLPFGLHGGCYGKEISSDYSVYPDNKLKWMYNYQKVYKPTEIKETISQSQIPEFADKPLDERCYMPIWGKLSFQIQNLVETMEEQNEIIKNYIKIKTANYYWGHNSHLQLKYLIGYWKARS